MDRVFRILRAPGAKRPVACAAPTCVAAGPYQDDEERRGDATVSTENANRYTMSPKPRLLDRYLDRIVQMSGSELAFFLILSALLTWAFLGIIFGHTTDWQVGISDAQAIINLVFDSFLMRQQLNSYERTLLDLGCLRSRTMSHKRMLRQLLAIEQYSEGDSNAENPTPSHPQPSEQTEPAPSFPAETPFGRCCTAVSNFLGHIATVLAFWVGIFVWIGFGAYCNWSTTWLLYINSATSALMVFVLAFLANIRERHSDYSTKCLSAIYKVDAALEARLRAVTGDVVANPTVEVPAPKVGKVQRVIDYYADLVGALIGIVILILTMIIWVVIGPAMRFDSSWWLLIGTYAGLVGMNDGFVLRNVYNKLRCYEDAQFEELAFEDAHMLSLIHAPQQQVPERVADDSLTARVSVKMGNLFSHEVTVVLGAVAILGLLIGASAMRWNLIGQLLCNVPPSIIETFFMMILITGHNMGDRRRRADLSDIHLKRVRMLRWVEGVGGR